MLFKKYNNLYVSLFSHRYLVKLHSVTRRPSGNKSIIEESLWSKMLCNQSVVFCRSLWLLSLSSNGKMGYCGLFHQDIQGFTDYEGREEQKGYMKNFEVSGTACQTTQVYIHITASHSLQVEAEDSLSFLNLCCQLHGNSVGQAATTPASQSCLRFRLECQVKQALALTVNRSQAGPSASKH